MSHICDVHLRRSDTAVPWGFRIDGGLDYGVPLRIMKVVDGSVACYGGLEQGDHVLQINGANTGRMCHDDVKMEIIRSANEIVFTVSRGSHGPSRETWRPNFTSTMKILSVNSPATSRATASPLQTYRTFYNAPVSFKNTDGPIVTQDRTGRQKLIIHNEHNSPMGLYSDGNISSVFTRTLRNADVATNAPIRTAQSLKAIHCGTCGDLIKGVFIKVHGKVPMHPGCLKCYKCGLPLKQVGYFYINDHLYCETHAKQVSRPSHGMQPVVVYK